MSLEFHFFEHKNNPLTLEICQEHYVHSQPLFKNSFWQRSVLKLWKTLKAVQATHFMLQLHTLSNRGVPMEIWLGLESAWVFGQVIYRYIGFITFDPRAFGGKFNSSWISTKVISVLLIQWSQIDLAIQNMFWRRMCRRHLWLCFLPSLQLLYLPHLGWMLWQARHSILLWRNNRS